MKQDYNILDIKKILKNKDQYVNNLKSWRKSIDSKIAWKKYRFHFQTGINRFVRKNSSVDHLKFISKLLKRKRKEVNPLLKQNESISFSFNDIDKLELLENISKIKLSLIKDISDCSLIEEYVDYSCFVDRLFLALNNLESTILSEKLLSISDFEIILSSFNKSVQEYYQNTYGKDFSINESFSYYDIISVID